MRTKFQINGGSKWGLLVIPCIWIFVIDKEWTDNLQDAEKTTIGPVSHMDLLTFR